MWKFSAVVSTRAGSCVVSASLRPWTSTAVTTFVLTPTMTCAFTQSCLSRTTPYLWSNQRVKRDAVKPVESAAKSTSTALSGRLLRTMRSCRIGVTSSLSR